MKVAEPRPNLVYWADVDKALNDALKEIVVDGKDVKATLDKYHQKIEEAKQNSGK